MDTLGFRLLPSGTPVILSAVRALDISGSVTPVQGFGFRVTQRAQHALNKEYCLNHNMKPLYFKLYSMIGLSGKGLFWGSGSWVLLYIKVPF